MTDDDEDKQVRTLHMSTTYLIRKEATGRSILIGLREPLTKTISENTFDLPLREGSEYYLNMLSPLGDALVRQLNEIVGITKVWVGRTDVCIRLGGAFCWENDLEHTVKEMIHAAGALAGFKMEEKVLPVAQDQPQD